MNATTGIENRHGKSSSKSRIRVFALLCVFAALLPVSARAESITSGQVWLLDGFSDDGFALRLVGAPPLCDGSPTSRHYGVVTRGYGATPETIKYMLSQATAAKLTGAQITVYASPGSGGDCAIRAIVW